MGVGGTGDFCEGVLGRGGGGGGGGRDSDVKGAGILIRNFELNP